MCGIAGFAGDFDRTLLCAMGRAMAHRGPDGSGERLLHFCAESAPVGLAHRRLSIIDLSAAGAQPMTVRCERCGGSVGEGAEGRGLWLAYNGEIYNFRELRAELEARGHRFHSHTDSEVLLHLYAEEGPAMLSRLNGIFALALFDGRETGQREGMRPGDLLLARDGMGVKPLYHAATPRGVLFASEIKAILQCAEVPRELDAAGLHHHLAYLWAPAPFTALKAIRKLPPGHALLLRDGEVRREWCHYDMPYGAPPLELSEEELVERLRGHLSEAVERQMVSDVPVGAFLSGGLDSSAVVAMMRRVRPDYRPRCFSIGFRGERDTEGNPSDLPYAREAARHLGVDLAVLEIESDAIRHLERMLYHLDEPQADPAPINALLIAEQARSEGIKVLLSGAGGDDIFGGYRRLRALSLEGYWRWLPAPARGAIAAGARFLSDGAGVPGLARLRGLRRAGKALAHADLPDDLRLVSYFWWMAEARRRSLYSGEFAAAVDGVDTAGPLLDSLRRIPEERDPLNRMLYLEARHFLADHNLNYTDKTAMAAGVEVRVPLLDPDLVGFAARVPSGWKQRGPMGKALFRKAMEPFLPHEVIYRPKTGFGAPLRRWLRTELREPMEEVLSTASLRSRGLFDPVAVRRLIDQDRRGEVEGAYTIFSLMCIELWCRIFVDAPVPEPPSSEASTLALQA